MHKTKVDSLSYTAQALAMLPVILEKMMESDVAGKVWPVAQIIFQSGSVAIQKSAY
jgi:hypothetical protein